MDNTNSNDPAALESEIGKIADQAVNRRSLIEDREIINELLTQQRRLSGLLLTYQTAVIKAESLDAMYKMLMYKAPTSRTDYWPSTDSVHDVLSSIESLIQRIEERDKHVKVMLDRLKNARTATAAAGPTKPTTVKPRRRPAKKQ